MRVSLYARVSSEGQADRGTIEAQVDFLRRYCELHGLEIAGEYLDEAVHGPVPLDKRPAGRRLIADARAKKFAKVLVYRTDRFARSLCELLDAQPLLDSLGVGLQSASEPYDTGTPVGRLVFQILGSIAELERATIVERGTTGKARVAKDGRWPGGPAPFGYHTQGGYLLPHPTEGPVVRELYASIAAGSTLALEARKLNDRGLRGRNGGHWNAGNLGKVLHSPVYKGQHVYRGKAGTITRSVPPLVSPALWAEAVAQLQINSTRRELVRFNLLRGKLRCMTCGGTFVGAATLKRGQVYYRCVRTTAGRAVRCQSANLNAKALEAYVWSECLTLLREPGRLRSYAEDKLMELEEEDAHRTERTQALQRGLVEQDQARQRILRLIRLDKVCDNEAEAELDLINAEVGRLHGQLSALDSSRSLAGDTRVSCGKQRR
jgi:site-specific DNA recombinase